MIFLRFKGHGFTAFMIQAAFMFTAMFVGMINEKIVWGILILKEIFTVLCIEIGLIISLPFLILLQKWLDKKGRTEDSVFGHRPIKWGLICCAFFAVLIITGILLTLFL